MYKRINRRNFIKKTLKTSIAMSLTYSLANIPKQALDANEAEANGFFNIVSKYGPKFCLNEIRQVLYRTLLQWKYKIQYIIQYIEKNNKIFCNKKRRFNVII